MNYLSVDNISKRIGEKVLFEGVSFGLAQGQKMALVARNGAGKTSMLKIIAGLDEPDAGQVAVQREISVGFLPQEPQLNEALTAVEEIYSAGHPAMLALRAYDQALEAAGRNEPGAEARLQQASAALDDLKAWDFEAHVRKVLFQLNITNLHQPVAKLSGGQRKRLALAKLIIETPDLLILDEPTNHLDLDMIEWLEGYLSRQQVSLLLVTHDRYFLDRICTHILELDHGRVFKYEGNYERYLLEKDKRLADEASGVDKAQNLMRKELEWMRRMPKARGTKAKYRIDNFYDLQRKAQSGRQEQDLQLELRMSRMGGKILELHGVTKRFGPLTILDDFEYVFKKQERIGIVGRNGVGKSTFLNMIMGLEAPDAGEIVTGETVVFGYYHQQGLKLEEDKRVIDVVKDIAEVIPVGKKGETISASQFLQRFQFPPEAQYTFASQLSGGERRRLHLLTVLVKNPNFLILDEPTNDLDLATLQTLEAFLDDYPGCLIIVSHDRYFMDRLADHLFIFEGEGKVKDFNGKYTEYRDWKQEQEREEAAQAKQAAAAQAPKPAAAPAAKRKMSFKEQREFEALEGEIEALEAEKAELAERMNRGGGYADLQAWAERIDAIETLLEAKSDRWLELSDLA
jgi:ATP-binding cassette subfamily F protein uup